MAEEIKGIKVKISVDNSEVGKKVNESSSQFSQLRGKVADAEKAFLKYGITVGAAAASMATMKLVSVTREFDILNAGLKTATGSAKGAAIAFDAIKDFAATTPFSVQQATEAFTKLVNLGLDPSEAAMRSYGNTASAMGKDLGQMIEAVADATTGEFERLKEFGIKAKSEGDNVSFTFQGVTTTIGKNAAEIENYLKGIGDNQFAGAMSERVNSLDGAISNLEDTWNQLFLTISQEGTGEVITDSVRQATAAIEELQDMIKSGQLQAQIKAIGMSFDGVTDDVLNMVELAENAMEELSEAGAFGASGIEGAFANMPENIRAFIQIMTVELAAFVDKTAAYGTEILENLKFWEDETFDLESKLKAIDEARLSSIDVILQEKDAFIESKNEQLKGAEELRRVFDEKQARKALEVEDRTAQFKLEIEQTEEHQANLTAAEKKAAEDRIKIAEAEGRARRDAISDMFSNLSSLMDSENKKQFKIGKQAAQAQTIVSTISSAQKSYEALAGIPVVGPALGIAAASAAILAGNARLQSINSASFNSGSISATQGGSSDVSAGGAISSGQTDSRNINITGVSPDSFVQVGGLVDMLNQELGDGATINFG